TRTQKLTWLFATGEGSSFCSTSLCPLLLLSCSPYFPLCAAAEVTIALPVPVFPFQWLKSPDSKSSVKIVAAPVDVDVTVGGTGVLVAVDVAVGRTGVLVAVGGTVVLVAVGGTVVLVAVGGTVVLVAV